MGVTSQDFEVGSSVIQPLTSRWGDTEAQRGHLHRAGYGTQGSGPQEDGNMVGEGAGLPRLLPNWERWLGKGLGATAGKGGRWDLSMGTLASGRPAESSLGSSLGPRGWTSLRTALGVGAGCTLWSPWSLNVLPRAQG